MPVRFPETETNPPTHTYRGHQYRHHQDRHHQDRQGRQHLQNRQGDDLDQDSDSDLIFDFEMEDSSERPANANTEAMDPEERLASITHPTTADFELFSSLRPATNAQGPLTEQSVSPQGSQESQNPQNPQNPQAAQEFRASLGPSENTPAQLFQPAQPQFWPHRSGSGSFTRNANTLTPLPTLRGRSHPVTSRTAYSPLAPHPHQLHQAHRYVTGRGFGSPGWNPSGSLSGGNRNASSSSQRSANTQQSERGSNQNNQTQQSQNGQNSQQIGQGYQVWQTQPQQNAPPAWPAPQRPLPPLPPLPPQLPHLQHLPLLQRQWQHYGSQQQPRRTNTSPWNPYNPLLDDTLHGRLGVGIGGQAQVGVATRSLSHEPSAILNPPKSEAASVRARCVIVNGSKRPYDVDMLNRLAWGDLALSPAGAESALYADDAGAKAVSLETGASLPSMVSDHGTFTDQSSLASTSSRMQLQPRVQSENGSGASSGSGSEFTITEAVPTQTPTQTQARTSTALTTISIAHHWLLKLPLQFWQRLAQYVDDDTLLKLSTIHRVFAKARVERVLGSKKREARLERQERQQRLERLERLERQERQERQERLDKIARLAELEERTTFVMGQFDRLSLSPSNSNQSVYSRYSRYSGYFSSSSSQLIHGQWPQCPKACFKCFRVRPQSHFPRVLVLSAATSVATTDVGEVQIPADIRAAFDNIVSSFIESQSQGQRQPHNRVPLPQPMFVPYIPIPADATAGSAGSSARTTVAANPGAVSSGSDAKTAAPETTHATRATHTEVEEPSYFDRCCFECAISAGLIKPGERVVSLDGSWRLVCRYGLAHAGGNEDICQDHNEE